MKEWMNECHVVWVTVAPLRDVTAGDLNLSHLHYVNSSKSVGILLKLVEPDVARATRRSSPCSCYCLSVFVGIHHQIRTASCAGTPPGLQTTVYTSSTRTVYPCDDVCTVVYIPSIYRVRDDVDHGCVTDYVWVMIWISSDKSCKVPVKSSPINQHPTFYRPDALPVAQPTVSKHSREKYHIPWTCLPPMSPRGFPTLSLTTKGSWLPWGGLPCPSPRQPGAFRSRSGSMIFFRNFSKLQNGLFSGICALWAHF